MKDYKVKTLINFNDLEENKLRKVNDEFYCTKERYDYLLKHNAVELIEVKKNDSVKKPKSKVSQPKNKSK